MLGGIFQGVDFNIAGDRVSLRLSFDRLNRKSALCGIKSLRHCQLFCEFSVPIQSTYISLLLFNLCSLVVYP